MCVDERCRNELAYKDTEFRMYFLINIPACIRCSTAEIRNSVGKLIPRPSQPSKQRAIDLKIFQVYATKFEMRFANTYLICMLTRRKIC